MRATAELLRELESKVESWTLVPSGGGRFEVSVDDELVYSKLKTGRHTSSDELRPLIKAKL